MKIYKTCDKGIHMQDDVHSPSKQRFTLLKKQANTYPKNLRSLDIGRTKLFTDETKFISALESHFVYIKRWFCLLQENSRREYRVPSFINRKYSMFIYKERYQ